MAIAKIGKLLIKSGKAYAKRKKKVSKSGLEARLLKKSKNLVSKGFKGIKPTLSKTKKTVFSKGKQSLLFTGKKLREGFKLAQKHGKPLKQAAINKLKIGARYGRKYGTKKLIGKVVGKTLGKAVAPAVAAWDYKTLMDEGYTKKEALIIAGSELAGWAGGAAVGAATSGGLASAGLGIAGGAGARYAARKSLGVTDEMLANRLKARSLFINQKQEVKAQAGGAN